MKNHANGCPSGNATLPPQGLDKLAPPSGPAGGHRGQATAARCPRRGLNPLAAACALLLAAALAAHGQSLGTTSLTEGPAAGTDSVVLAMTPATQAWTATANDPWLHLSAANQGGIGSTHVVFTFDANPGATRTGALTVAGRTLAVTQAGATYIAANPFTTLVSSGLNEPFGVAVDGAGTVYVANQVGNAIEKLPRAFVDPTPKLEGPSAGTEVLPVVLPATVDLVGSLAPSCDQPWLTIGSIVDGVVSLNFSANAGPAARTAHITLLGQVISVTQAAPLAPPTLLGATLLANGLFQFAFSNASPGAGFTVLSATYLSTPLTNWTVLGTATNSAPGWFQFTTPAPTTDPQRFYRVRSP